jgi:D-alanine-D-alanine ligase
MTATQDFGKVAVLMGGTSAERDVSLKSGAAVLAALQSSGVDAHGVDVGVDIARVLQDGAYDCAFIALHGRGGEDGVIQGLLNALGIPFTGSGVLGSALSMDKVRSKQVWQAVGLPTLPFVVLDKDAQWESVASGLGLPIAVKPAREGSSIGTTKVVRAEDLEPAWREAAKYDEVVMAEPWIEGGEYTVAILKGKALPVIRLETPHTFYDYAAKYEADDTQYHCPCGLDADFEASLQAMAVKAFNVLGASGWGRVDFMLDGKGQPWLLENNTVPGLTDHSLVPMAAKAAGISFAELVLQILAGAQLESGLGGGHGRKA